MYLEVRERERVLVKIVKLFVHSLAGSSFERQNYFPLPELIKYHRINDLMISCRSVRGTKQSEQSSNRTEYYNNQNVVKNECELECVRANGDMLRILNGFYNSLVRIFEKFVSRSK